MLKYAGLKVYLCSVELVDQQHFFQGQYIDDCVQPDWHTQPNK